MYVKYNSWLYTVNVRVNENVLKQFYSLTIQYIMFNRSPLEN